MAKGDVYSSEKREFSDPATDVCVVQLTDQPCANTNAYYNQEQFIGGSERFVFTSNRTGTQQLYTVEVASGKIVQLTDDEPSGGFTVDSQRGIVYFGRGRQFLALDVESLREEAVAESPEGCGPIGSPDLSSCGRYLVLGCGPESRRRSFAYRYGREAMVLLCDVVEKRQEVVYHGPSADNQATPDSHVFISRGDPSYVWFGSYSRLQPTGIKTAFFMKVDLERLRPIHDPMRLFDQQPYDYINHYYSAPDAHVESFHYRHTAYDRDGIPIAPDQKLAMLLDVDLARGTTSRWVFPGLAPTHFKCNNADDMWAGDRADPGFLWLEGRGADSSADSKSDEYWLHYWPEASPPSFPAHEWIGVFQKHHSSYLEVRPLVRHKTTWWEGVHPHPVFSPDDKWIAYCAGGKDRSQLYLAEAVWPRWPK